MYIYTKFFNILNLFLTTIDQQYLAELFYYTIALIFCYDLILPLLVLY